MATTKTNIKLDYPKECIKNKEIIPAPASCPYDNFFIKIEYTNGDIQVMTQKTPNDKALGTHEFENKDELFEFFKTI